MKKYSGLKGIYKKVMKEKLVYCDHQRTFSFINRIYINLNSVT